ncbi:tRNA (cytidine(34)-2'-O)-methyltransferase [Magnetovibrio blakemorei]|uniref:tRNA (cytidine(34)-2'-O)-methyltransferase n=1 Tax=Magnetovibrio blakemorei TaxID=28181 RepID=A0A1E5Q8J8_9PROT|nr:tRNA (cytidine(34)-2'-O)-methyltransferase [Magnetovibrio blakemorei]OEJ67114.1 tRNA methyltransferase [Magnetovibrio blakemorei]
MNLALFQPDIPQNTGTLLRTCACLGIEADIIEPCGFVFSDRHLKRSGMDYLDLAQITRHVSWQAFRAKRQVAEGRRLVLLTTKGAVPYTQFSFMPSDVLLLGSESQGVPDDVHDAVDARLTIQMRPEARSLNIAVAAAMVLGEALRQIGGQAQLLR